MTDELVNKKTGNELRKLSTRLTALLDIDPAEAVRQARLIDLTSPDRLNAMSVRAAILVDGGAVTHQIDAIHEGLKLFRELYSKAPNTSIAYNLANALFVAAGNPPDSSGWVDHKESTRDERAEARRLYWSVAQDNTAPKKIQTQALTNLGNQFARSYRLGEAHDTHLAALAIEPDNGVAAGFAARNLIWIYRQGGCSELTKTEAILLAKIAKQHADRVREYAGERVATELSELADELGDPPPRTPHTDPFIQWVERERLTLAPAVELVDPSLGKLDWLMLPGILEREPGAGATTPPPLFAMFNVLKADFILARDLAWKTIGATDENIWPTTGRFADTLDFATYGPEASALIFAHRTALDLLDKVAVTANHYFKIGLPPNKIYFGRMWRENPGKRNEAGPLVETVDAAIRSGANALYGLVELAEDYSNEDGILRPQKNLRNAGTHRFVVLHDLGDLADTRQTPEVDHHDRERFAEEVIRALRVARSALQMLALAIRQHERSLAQGMDGLVGTMVVPDHDWIRGHEEDGP